MADFWQWDGGAWETVTPGRVRQDRDDLLAQGKAATTVRRRLGQRLTYLGIREVMDGLREATGIDVHAHRFRHTFATRLLLQGMDSFKAMTLTRHKSVQAFKRYVKRAEQAAAEQEFWERLE